MDEKLLHAVGRYRRLVYVDSPAEQVSVHSINVGRSKEECHVTVGRNTERGGRRRPLVVLVSGIQHQVHAVELQPYPIVVGCGCVVVGLYDLETEHSTVEL